MTKTPVTTIVGVCCPWPRPQSWQLQCQLFMTMSQSSMTWANLQKIQVRMWCFVAAALSPFSFSTSRIWVCWGSMVFIIWVICLSSCPLHNLSSGADIQIPQMSTINTFRAKLDGNELATRRPEKRPYSVSNRTINNYHGKKHMNFVAVTSEHWDSHCQHFSWKHPRDV